MRIFLLLSILFVSACADRSGQAKEEEGSDAKAAGIHPDALRELQDLRRQLSLSTPAFEGRPEAHGAGLAKEDLGRALFFDARLSGDQSVSCNSCHNLQAYGVSEAEFGGRDVPTIYNLSELVVFDWDGDQTRLPEKISESLVAEDEMNLPHQDELLSRLEGIQGYAPLFAAAYPDAETPLSYSNAVSALQSFVLGLRTPAPVDRFLAGDDHALTPEQIKGGHLFIKNDCRACHTGELFGGQMLQKVGIAQKWPNQFDLGAYRHTKRQAFKMFFRVSPLRNVEQTGPYFHDGSSADLLEAIQRMALYERGELVDRADAKRIQHFLSALTGELPTDYIAAPELPE